MTYPSRYDLDPEALAWARAKAQAEIDRAEKFVADATAAGDGQSAEFWRRYALHLHRSFVGGEGCVMGRFDERLPELYRSAAVSAVVEPPADRAALRDRIAAAIWERQNPGRRYADCEYRWRADAEEDADAVLAVLPEPTDRAAVLREAIDVAREEGHRLEVEVGIEAARGARCVAYLLRKRLAKEQPLRRMADETATTQTQADGTQCRTCTHPADWHDPHEGCVGPNGIGGLGSNDCPCTEHQPAAGARQDGATP